MSSASRSSAAPILVAVLLVLTLLATGVPWATVGATPPDHLVVSEVVTGGVSASDEFIEIHNPTASALPLEGLELVYVTASGATISRRAAWELGAPDLAPGGHVLVANELGAYAGIADVLYGSGMASTGGSVAVRIQGAASAIDAVGWGTAASTWLEGVPAPAPAAGSSLERLPGGALGSTVDTDDNLSDFAVRSVPEPQNLGSAATPDPSATPSPTPTVDPNPTVAPTADPTPSTTFAPTPTPTSTPNDELLPIGTARTLPDGTAVTIEGTALTDAGFTDGGGFVADASGGIAVIVSDGTFARGDRLRLTGTIDDRFSQRTLRVGAAGVTVLGIGTEPVPAATSTGAVGENVEGRLVRVVGSVLGSPSELSTGLAFDLDDGTGTTRLVVGTATGIDASAWKAGSTLDLVGVVGQRDSSGTGIGGYRVYPRDGVDIVAVDISSTASPAPSDAPAGTITIAAARSLPKNAHARVRGTVTLPPGIVDPATAVLQDASGAIVIRIGEDVGPLSRGDLVVVDGVRSTKSGMETLRVTTPPTQTARGAEPAPEELRTGTAGEGDEAKLVQVRGALVAAARRSSSGTLSLEIDDGSGPLRISIGASVGAAQEPLTTGTWLAVTGVLGQDTTGAQPLRGYRVWPRDTDDLRILAAPTGVAGSADAGGSSSPSSASDGLSALGGGGGDPVRIGATLVAAAWPDIGIGGLLWDGDRLVALASSAAEDVERLLDGGGPPLSVELFGLRAAGTLDALGLPIVRLGEEPDALLSGGAPVALPATRLPDRGQAPRWVAVVGRLAQRDGAAGLALPDQAWVALDVRCAEVPAKLVGVVGVLGVATADPARIVVPCGGMRSAPGLDTARGIAAIAVASPGGATLAADGSGGSQSRPRPIGAVALLGVAALGLVAAGVVTRRIRDGDGGVEAEVPDEGDAPGSDAAQPPAGPPMLTLVTLPRDRAP